LLRGGQARLVGGRLTRIRITRAFAPVFAGYGETIIGKLL
jgi:hypothetical protein